MGIKMLKAKFGEQQIRVSDYKELMKMNLRCIYCDVPITYVSGYKKEVGGREVHVNPYFRLKNKDNPHKNGCNFITANIVKKIFSEVSDSDLVTRLNDKYVTRLHIITENTENSNKERENVEMGDSIQNKPTKKYIKNGEKPAYLSTIKRIVKLKEALDNDKELRDLVILQFYNEQKKTYDEIRWKDFYVDYDLKQYKYIYELIKNEKVQHPICFTGEIKEVKKIDDKEIYAIQFYSLKKEKGEYLALSIFTKSEDVFNYVSGLINKKVVIYGCNHHIGKINTSEKNNRKTTYYNFVTRINVKRQVFVLD